MQQRVGGFLGATARLNGNALTKHLPRRFVLAGKEDDQSDEIGGTGDPVRDDESLSAGVNLQL